MKKPRGVEISPEGTIAVTDAEIIRRRLAGLKPKQPPKDRTLRDRLIEDMQENLFRDPPGFLLRGRKRHKMPLIAEYVFTGGKK